jgi:hypothetical protein
MAETGFGLGTVPPAATKKTHSLALRAWKRRRASFFQRNVSTAMLDLESAVGTGLEDRVVFLGRVAYSPLQYALRSPTMNRVGMESSAFLPPSPCAACATYSDTFDSLHAGAATTGRTRCTRMYDCTCPPAPYDAACRRRRRRRRPGCQCGARRGRS